MFDFFKNLFNKSPLSPSFGLGSLPSPADARNIDIASVQPNVNIPSQYMTDMTIFGVENQGSKPACVGYAMSKLAEYYIFKHSGKMVKLSARALYAECKKNDGIPTQGGTFATVAAAILINKGVPRDDQVLDDPSLADPQYLSLADYGSNEKISTGYAFVPTDFHEVCQAIFQNGIVSVGLYISSDWFRGIIGKALSVIGGHQTNLHGYDFDMRRVYGENQWGIEWIGQIAGVIDSKVKPGFYVANWDDIQANFINIIAFVPIPKKVLDDVHNTGYHFVTTMRFGSSGYEVKKLQEYFGLKADGSFGKMTQDKVIAWQKANSLVPDGIIGAKGRAILNASATSYIPQWIAAIKAMEGAKPERNNPGNLRFVNQLHAVNDNGFCKFDTYQHGYDALESLLRRACTGQIKPTYYPSMTLVEFYHKYAPSSDGNDPNHYANFVAKRLGVPANTQIADLL